MLFRYVANFLYDGDAPLAERRAQALAIDQSQLRELLGEPELRELLDPDALAQTELELQHLDERHKAQNADAIHDLLLRLGDLSAEEIAARVDRRRGADARRRARRSSAAFSKCTSRARSASSPSRTPSRYRDALGTPIPHGVAERYLQPVADPVGDLVLRFARTHGPFTPSDVAQRYGLGIAVVTLTLERFVERGRLIEGEFRPAGRSASGATATCCARSAAGRSRNCARKSEPVDQPVLARLFTTGRASTRKRRGLDALLEVVETLQGFPMAASIFESDILAARIDDYKPSDLDTLSAAGEIVWVGVEPLGERDGRIALYLTDHLPLLHAQRRERAESTRSLDYLRSHGASFFTPIQAALGGFPRSSSTRCGSSCGRAWSRTTRSTPCARSRVRSSRARRRLPLASRGAGLDAGTLVARPAGRTRTKRSARTRSRSNCSTRYGVVTREAPALENVFGGFSAVYPILKAMEDAGRVRRGYFVAGLGATQFASGGAIDLLRSLRDEPETPETVMLAATDPANPYGAIVKWPESPGCSRAASARR